MTNTSEIIGLEITPFLMQEILESAALSAEGWDTNEDSCSGSWQYSTPNENGGCKEFY